MAYPTTGAPGLATPLMAQRLTFRGLAARVQSMYALVLAGFLVLCAVEWMRRSASAGSPLLVAGLLVLCAGSAGQAGTCAAAATPSPPAEPLPGTEREIRALMADIAPQIERVMERKFKKLPPVVIDDTQATARILAADMVPLVRRQYAAWPESRLQRHALAIAQRLAPELLGKYGVQAETLALHPRDLPDTLRQHRIDPVHAPGILKTLVAHELTHGLQAQYVDLLALSAKASTDDALAAATAVIEGQAMLVQQEVGKALG